MKPSQVTTNLKMLTFKQSDNRPGTSDRVASLPVSSVRRKGSFTVLHRSSLLNPSTSHYGQHLLRQAKQKAMTPCRDANTSVDGTEMTAEGIIQVRQPSECSSQSLVIRLQSCGRDETRNTQSARALSAASHYPVELLGLGVGFVVKSMPSRGAAVGAKLALEFRSHINVVAGRTGHQSHAHPSNANHTRHPPGHDE